MSADVLIVPVLNVFGTGGVMQEKLPEFTCLDGCIYVMGEIASQGVIYQSDKMLRVIFGYRPQQEVRLLSERTLTRQVKSFKWNAWWHWDRNTV